MSHVLVVVLLASATVGTLADAHEPLGVGREGLAPQTTVLGVQLGADNFARAFRKLGVTEVRDNGGDAAANATAACYAGKDGTTLALISSGEQGGGWLTAFQLATRKALIDFSGDIGGGYAVPQARRPRCRTLETLSAKTETDGGLHLGMKLDDVLQLLGKPCGRKGKALRFCSVEKGRSTPALVRRFRQQYGEGDYERFEAYRWVIVEFENESVVSVRVEQTYS